MNSDEANKSASQGQQSDPNAADRQPSFIQSSDASPNYVLGALAGAAASIACAALWCAITFYSGWQIGLMAIALGCVVGMSVRKFGKGTDKSFGIIASLEALLGCMAGNLFTACLVLSKHTGVSFLEILGRLSPDVIVDLMSKTFDVMDLLFYGFAVYQAFKLATAPAQVLSAAPESAASETKS